MGERFLVTGADGFLGKRVFDELTKVCVTLGVDVRGKNNLGVEVIDVTDREKLVVLVKKFRPSVVVHVAAMALPDDCEKNPDRAWEVNVGGTENVVRVCREVGARVVFTSSLHVFDGARGDYTEEDEPCPVNVYGKSKLEAEGRVLVSSQNIVFRVATVYGYNGSEEGSLVSILRQLARNESVEGWVDTYRNYTWVDDFVPAMLKTLEFGEGGVFNFCSFEASSDYAFVLRLAEVFGFPASLVREGLAKPFYPRKVTLVGEKMRKLGVRMHSLSEGLRLTKKQMANAVYSHG